MFGINVVLTDAAASGSSDVLSLSVSNGLLSFYTGGITILSGANSSPSATITGTLANLNLAVGSIEYLPNNNYVGPDSLQLSVVNSLDSFSASASVPIAVVPTPSVTAPAVFTVRTVWFVHLPQRRDYADRRVRRGEFRFAQPDRARR